jgi:hypothetical protein
VYAKDVVVEPFERPTNQQKHVDLLSNHKAIHNPKNCLKCEDSSDNTYNSPDISLSPVTSDCINKISGERTESKEPSNYEYREASGQVAFVIHPKIVPFHDMRRIVEWTKPSTEEKGVDEETEEEVTITEKKMGQDFRAGGVLDE